MKQRPTAGVLPPNGSVRIDLSVPLEIGEQPMLLTATGVQCKMEIHETMIAIKNETPSFIPFVLVIVPQSATLVQLFATVKQLLSRGG